MSFNLVREFNAPREMVFNAFGSAEALSEWWGPVETKNTVISLDFKAGGIFHFKMGDNAYGRFLFSKVQPYDLLEFTNAFADEHANIIPAPFEISIPAEIRYTLVFIEKNGKTTIDMTGTPVNATEEEEAVFRSIGESMQQGFGATFDKLDTYLEKQ